MSEQNDAPETSGDDQQAAPPAQTPEPAPVSDAPWAKDLEAQFTDPEVRGQVDEFMRGKVQPYVTELEQRSQPNRDATRLWNDLSENPNDTLVTVVQEIYGEEYGNRLLRALASGDTEAQPPQGADESDEDYEFRVEENELPPNVREAVDFVQQQRQEQEFSDAMASLREDNPDVEIKDNLFYPFIVQADGDLDAALDSYKEWTGAAKEEFGSNAPADIPPPTITPDKVAPTAPPQEKKGQSLDEAMDDWFAEQKAAPPTA